MIYHMFRDAALILQRFSSLLRLCLRFFDIRHILRRFLATFFRLSLFSPLLRLFHAFIFFFAISLPFLRLIFFFFFIDKPL